MSSPDSPGSHLSLSLDRQEALSIFKNVSDRSLVLALLSWITPPADWEGGEITLGQSTPDRDHLIHVGVRGPHAGQIRDQLLSALARVEINTVELGHGELAQETVLVRAADSRWQSP